ncbi:DMT family transporter [Vibrio tetraodonis]|uniref:DMT family transporter n=1 Tax=Vibrio tetraodonis TaxID=2231647 RepID=UPI000E0AF585|nr:DMT family transporter [Vibrio tetraodonis]
MWFFAALCSAFFLSLRDISTKKTDVSGIKSAYFILLIIQPISIVIISYFGIQDIDSQLVLLLSLASFLDTIAIVCYALAVKLGKVSEVAPILCLIPVFQLLLNYFFQGFTPSIISFFGVLCSLIFVFYGQGANWKKMLSNRSFLLMLCVALCWSVSSILHREGALIVSPVLWTSLVVTASMIYISIYMVLFTGESLKVSGIRGSILASISHFLTLITFYWASSLGNVAYVSVVRRLSSFFSALFSLLFLSEEVTKRQWICIIGLIFSAALIIIGSQKTL